jgi:hypothetical protein
MSVRVCDGDLLDQDVVVIVNAWNRNIIPWWLLLPQGVSGAIKRRAGYEPFRELARHGPLPLGGAAETGAGWLSFRGIEESDGRGRPIFTGRRVELQIAYRTGRLTASRREPHHWQVSVIMSAIFSRASSGCATVTLTSQPQPHRPHRHKKFRVRPEALGEGYATYDVVTQSSSPPPPDSPPTPSTLEAEGIAANAPAPTVATLASEWEEVSEKQMRFRAAQNALRLLFWGIVLLFMLVLVCGYRGWLWRVFGWLRQFPLPTI